MVDDNPFLIPVDRKPLCARRTPELPVILPGIAAENFILNGKFPAFGGSIPDPEFQESTALTGNQGERAGIPERIEISAAFHFRRLPVTFLRRQTASVEPDVQPESIAEKRRGEQSPNRGGVVICSVECDMSVDDSEIALVHQTFPDIHSESFSQRTHDTFFTLI